LKKYKSKTQIIRKIMLFLVNRMDIRMWFELAGSSYFDLKSLKNNV